MKRFLLLLFLIPLTVMSQQKAMFSQYMFNGLVVNPAYSSVDEALSITSVSRHQWVGFNGAPNTQTFSIHSPIKESNSSAGLMFIRDQIGEVLTDNAIMLSFSQRVQLSEETYLAVGIDGGISQFQAGYSTITDETSATDPLFNNENELRGNVGAGVMLFSQRFYAGISSPFLLSAFGSTASRTAHRPHYLLQGGYLAPLGESLQVKPNLLVKYVNGSPVQVDLNANFLIKETVWLGASWRSFDSIDFMTEVQLTPNIQFGYSYDFTTTELAQVQRATHEIMLNFRLPVKGRGFPKCYF